MARRNDHTREELINLTLTTVKNFLDENSYHELSLRKIANMIGYVPSTLVNIFGNYNLLLLHAVAQTLDELSQEALNATKQKAVKMLIKHFLNLHTATTISRKNILTVGNWFSNTT